ncbi:sulfotransferase domain-containing protein [bacterium]|nr:sulfotransferase domain-containing protein [bacterium]
MAFLSFLKNIISPEITVVSGLPRSGTSMMMKMLEAGGIPPLQDNIRTADEDNPKGYYEFERVKKLPKDTAWLPEAKGKAVKIIALLLTKLPLKGYRYKVLFMRRDIEEILASQKRMLVRRGEATDKVSDEEMITTYHRHLSEVLSFLDANPCFTVFFVNYNDLMRDPADWIPRINVFVGGKLDEEAMKAVVDPNLYRNRR